MEKFTHSKQSNGNEKCKIILVDDEPNIIDSLSIYSKISGHDLFIVSEPFEAVEQIKNKHFDLMLLNFSMNSINNVKILEDVRRFDKKISILLLTDNSNPAPSLELIKRLDIQGYFEKNTQFGQLLLLIDSAVKNIYQMNLINEINDELSRTLFELEKSYMETIQTLRHTVEAKDPYTRGHSDRVSAYSVLIGKYMALDEGSLNLLRVGGLFHDIGKIAIPDKILLKPRKLANSEYSQIKKHPSIGAHILSSYTLFKDIIPIVACHHERYDGNGYPSKISGDSIPFLARIVAISDAFDSMTSRRSYRDVLPINSVISEFNNCKGSQFDPKITDVFLDILNNHFDEIEDIKSKFIV